MLNYRADIDGLRAIAVLLVLLYHLDFLLFTGGFVGVDVFFTISGFLITSIVVKQVKSGDFSFREFYIRRAFRLLPAAITVIFTTIAVGYFILPPIAYSDLLNSAIAASMFVSNFYFFIEQGGYFATASHELPLLHTWSLAVEEQFYLLMPVLFFVLLKNIKSTANVIWIILWAFLLSSIFSYFLTIWHASIAYFFVGSRASEFLIGSLLALLIFHKGEKIKPSLLVANILLVVALVGLIGVAISIDKNDLFPGWLALLPCLFTVLIIFSGLNKNSLGYLLLGNRFMVFVGLLSYSLYLWHWPLISYAKYLNIPFILSTKLSIFALSILLAYCSWRFVETKFRQPSNNNRGVKASMIYVIPATALISFTWVASTYHFFPARFSQQVISAELALESLPEADRDSCHSSQFNLQTHNCLLGEKSSNKLNAVLWGDSHANHFVGFMDVYGKEKGWLIRDITMGSCPPLPEIYIDTFGARAECREKNDKVMAFLLSNDIKNVFLAASWGGYSNGKLARYNGNYGNQAVKDALLATVEELLDNQVNVTVLKMVPRMKEDNSSCYLKHIMHPNKVASSECHFVFQYSDEHNDLYSSVVEQFGTQVSFIDINELLCKGNECSSYVNSIPVYRDSNHLNQKGSEALARKYLSQLD